MPFLKQYNTRYLFLYEKIQVFKISKSKKLRYTVNNPKDKLYVVFLHGFMSDIEGEKPQAFKKFTIKKKLGFLAIEYSGHGKSSGKFTSGNITKWTNDAKLSNNKIIKKANIYGMRILRSEAIPR